MQTRRSFLSSLVAAVVLSPVVCNLVKSFEVVAPASRKAELWEQKSEWDGTLSPYFLAKYGYASELVNPKAGIAVLLKPKCS